MICVVVLIDTKKWFTTNRDVTRRINIRRRTGGQIYLRLGILEAAHRTIGIWVTGPAIAGGAFLKYILRFTTLAYRGMTRYVFAP